MANQTSVQSKPWYTPFRIVMGMMILTCIRNLIAFKFIVKSTLNSLSGITLFFLMLWPLILLVDAIIYWVIRKRITERKWVWAHLLFSLFAFVLLLILRVVVSFLAITHNLEGGRASIQIFNAVEGYFFWGSIIIGHIFFVVAIVRIYSGNSAKLPPDDNDLLSEVAG